MARMTSPTVPVSLSVGGVEIPLGTVAIHVTARTATLAPDPRRGMALQVGLDVDQAELHQDLADLLRRCADQLQGRADG